MLAEPKGNRDCPVCKGTIKKIAVNRRRTYICPTCRKM
ncbi:MAG: zinc finger domain-containing protein [Thermodesulfobacteriota bacterium]